MKAFVMAAGAGTRLRPLTYAIPKPMVPVVNKPVLEHTIENLAQHGFRRIVMNLHAYPAIIKKIQSRGIGILGAFIVGLDDDDLSVFDSLYAFIMENRLYAAQVTVLTPLPGTRLRQRLQDAGRILTSEWERYTFVDVNFRPMKMSAEELQAGTLDLYQRIYSKESRSAVLKHFRQIYRTLRRAQAGSRQ